jgi:hypothetical protein
MRALAYLNHGRWVVDCPADGCTDARAVYASDTQRLTSDVCARGHPIEIVMPDEQAERQIVAAVSERRDDADRAWYPAGHRRAILQGFPTGQSVADLHEETRQVVAFRNAEKTQRRERLRALIGELGLEFDPATGTVRGL